MEQAAILEDRAGTNNDASGERTRTLVTLVVRDVERSEFGCQHGFWGWDFGEYRLDAQGTYLFSFLIRQ